MGLWVVCQEEEKVYLMENPEEWWKWEEDQEARKESLHQMMMVEEDFEVMKVGKVGVVGMSWGRTLINLKI